MNRRAKFDAASFILGGEIRNHTNKHTHTQTGTSVFGDSRISTYADPTSTRRGNVIGTPWSHQLKHSSSFTRWPIRPILGLWGSKVPQNVIFARNHIRRLERLK